MNLPDLKQLDKVVALCRKRGIKSIKIDNVEITLSEDAPKTTKRKSRKAVSLDQLPETEATSFESDTPSELELLFASCGGVPEEFKDGI